MGTLDITLLPKGNVKYWSVYYKTWQTEPAWFIADRELAAMNAGERARIAAHQH